MPAGAHRSNPRQNDLMGPQLLRRVFVIFLALGALGAAFLSGAYAHKYREAIRARLRSLQSSPVIQTNLYNLRVEKLAVQGEGRDGAIDVLGDGLLFVNRKGRAWYVSKQRALQPLTLQVPINLAEFEGDSTNATTTAQDRFSIKDILVQQIPSGVRVLASHMYWHRERHCNTLRVSAIETTTADILAGRTGAATWRTLLETSCRELNTSPDGRTRHVTLGAGGRLAQLSERQILLTVGEFIAEHDTDSFESATELFGKTALIDLTTGSVNTFTQGHRNPQGLTVAPDARIWLTEHAARGGDELNLLVRGRHYGAPHVSYGTQYEMMVWPRSKIQGRHEGYEKPFFAWVPSIAPSQLIVVSGKSFPWWSGDLLVSALESRSLYRVHVEGDRVAFVEPISIGHRIRDIVETPEGSIVLKTDDDFLVFIDNFDTAPSASLDSVTRGAIVSGQCSSCHSLTEGAPSGIGPNLWGVLGRRVATASGYSYSSALQRVGGVWTPERLREFVRNPSAFAPGNRMLTATTYSDQQLDDLLYYLQTLR